MQRKIKGGTMRFILVLVMCLFTTCVYAEMDLYDGFTASDEETTEKIAVHTFSAGLRELARGAITKTQFVNAFDLNATQEANLDSIIAKYNSLSTATEKVNFIIKFHDVSLLSEAGFYNKVKAKEELGF